MPLDGHGFVETPIDRGMEEDAKQKALDGGKIKGDKKKIPLQFTDTTENLVRFYGSAADKMFSDELELKKEKPQK